MRPCKYLFSTCGSPKAGLYCLFVNFVLRIITTSFIPSSWMAGWSESVDCFSSGLMVVLPCSPSKQPNGKFFCSKLSVSSNNKLTTQNGYHHRSFSSTLNTEYPITSRHTARKANKLTALKPAVQSRLYPFHVKPWAKSPKWYLMSPCLTCKNATLYVSTLL